MDSTFHTFFSDGKEVAWTYNCKYIEVSAVLNHKVDELLVGVLSQIKLHQAKIMKKPISKALSTGTTCLPQEMGCFQKAAHGLFAKLVRGNACMFRSCDNLFEL